MSSTRPKPTTMEGMIWNANDILEKALSPKVNGIPKGLFNDLAGIAIVSSVQMGLILAGTSGTGIVLKKTSTGWSPPVAVGLSGLGFGVVIGASTRDIMIFIYDDVTLERIASKHGCKLGAQLDLVVVGPFGRTADTSTHSKGGVFGIAHTEGAFAGFSLEGAVLAARPLVNHRFYRANPDPKDILFTPKSVKLPSHVREQTVIDDVYDKLDELEKGNTAEPDAAEQAKKELTKSFADQMAESIKDSAEVDPVDSAAEDSKESSS